ncbi:unnamed protein product [Chondrus crispus]|uniref:Uncharacterized protein n=1 Tax=Chondrus crispus TaxID=2769 RepID=R7QGE0_CHOCR|nr:unnamed protein product [Chondrus crispus]CDF37154.1 unnamed protein product [Chondrus crispus]|eukprot:XP_005716973.1 unnamed protein product [Chondrus crispus]
MDLWLGRAKLHLVRPRGSPVVHGREWTFWSSMGCRATQDCLHLVADSRRLRPDRVRTLLVCSPAPSCQTGAGQISVKRQRPSLSLCGTSASSSHPNINSLPACAL